MDTFTVYVAIKANAPIDDSTVERVAGGFRSEDEEMCLWRDEYGAVRPAHLDRRPGVDEVIAMTEEGQLEWRPR